MQPSQKTIEPYAYGNNSELVGKVMIEDNMDLVNIGVKIILLKKTVSLPPKLCLGFYLEPKESLDEQKKADLRAQIAEGRFAPADYRNFVSARIAQPKDILAVAKLIGRSARMFYMEACDDPKTVEMAREYFLRKVIEGWDGTEAK